MKHFTQHIGTKTKREKSINYIDDIIGRPTTILFGNANINASVTGTLTETALATFYLPANTIKAGDILRPTIFASKTGTAGTLTTILRIDDNYPSVSPTSIVNIITAANITSIVSTKGLLFVSSPTTQINQAVANSNTIDGASTFGVNNLSINFTIPQYIYLTITLGNTGDTGTIRAFYLELIRPSFNGQIKFI